MNIEIIDMWEYYQRIVFLTKIGSKYQLFYKSTGMNHKGTEGNVFPILLLKEDKGWSPDGFGYWNAIGWLPKLFVFGGKFQEYRYKERSEFPKSMHEYMDYLAELNISDLPSIIDPKEINDRARKFIKSREDYVDWGSIKND